MNVVFDVGNVLLRWEPMPVLEEILGGAAALAAFHERVDFMAFHAERDRGRTLEEAVADMTGRAPEYAGAVRAFYDRWLDTIPGPIPASVAVLETLAARGPVYAITNFPAEEWRRTVPEHPFLGRFTDVVVSGEVGLTKPDPAIYRLLLTRNALAPETCLFIDDSARNVAAARDVGMAAIHFTEPAALAPALRERGLTP